MPLDIQFSDGHAQVLVTVIMDLSVSLRCSASSVSQITFGRVVGRSRNNGDFVREHAWFSFELGSSHRSAGSLLASNELESILVRLLRELRFDIFVFSVRLLVVS